MSGQEKIYVGKISGVFGIQGWVKVFSYTEPKENILRYSPWILEKGSSSKTFNVIGGKLQGRGVVARLDQVVDRDQAADLKGWDVLIAHDQLPPSEADEYYWSDLIGLAVENREGIPLGIIDNLMETGANDVLIVKGDRERAIPFLQGHTVVKIDLNEGVMVVDWDSEF